ncbi:DUF6494 family protein [Sinorhizobium fredii]|uniref:DUF6494 family protein n=1 Tax=Rhizobium fredii TaxID=380 RepID=UPI001296B901|nr:DUF6494 family protein [Sinorhizobium fredii]MQW97414.1 hypothetical protein [Sinorhizobium fredii]UTY46667.1 hypothetical protein EPK84_07265 [Sinorhizobium fredii]
MSEDASNMSIREFLKEVGITSQRKIEETERERQIGGKTQGPDMRSEFASTLATTVERGIGRLVDANMDDETTRLKALQTQERVALQTLQIAIPNLRT